MVACTVRSGKARICDYTGADAARERQYHDGPVRPSRDTGEAGSTEPSGQFNSVPKRSQTVDGFGCNCLNRKAGALNSAVECHLHTSSLFNTFNNLTGYWGLPST